MLTRSLVLMFIASVVVATVAGGLVGWGLSSATLAGAHGTTGEQGAVGAAGAKGDTGATGAAGNTGATGATGATGSRGATGVSGSAAAKGDKGDTGATGAGGAPGPQGIQGATGTAGTNGTNGVNGTNGTNGADGTNASIATFSFTSPTGVFPQAPFNIPVASMGSPIPAGPSLIGFSMSVTTPSPFSPIMTCGLYDLSTPTPTLLAAASAVTLQPNVSATTALTQVVSLTASTIVTLECSTAGLDLDPISYSNLSIYGLSFATN